MEIGEEIKWRGESRRRRRREEWLWWEFGRNGGEYRYLVGGLARGCFGWLDE